MLKSLLKSLFGARDVKTNHSYTDYVPGTQLTYDPDLINRLQDDHQERIKLYTSCAKSLEKGNHDQLRKTLEKFNRKLTSHLPLENIRFYTYMRYLLNTDKDNSTLLRHFQSEMSGIGRVVFAFLDKYTRPGIRYDETFKEEFDSIGTALTVCIESEENDLYVLHTPPSSI